MHGIVYKLQWHNLRLKIFPLFISLVDYPYPANFLESLPAKPVKAVCSFLQKPLANDTMLLQGIAKGLNVYFNHTGNSKCFNTNQDATSHLGIAGWNFQVNCSTLFMSLGEYYELFFFYIKYAVVDGYVRPTA